MSTAQNGTWLERKAWILLALVAGLLIVFGIQMMLPTDLSQPIQGSPCCSGRTLAEAPEWTVSYMGELARYMGTFTIGMGVLALGIVTCAYRKRARWSWAFLWTLPALFAFHGLFLGSFPFDLGPLAVSLAGLLVPVRTFATRSPGGGRVAQPTAEPVSR